MIGPPPIPVPHGDRSGGPLGRRSFVAAMFAGTAVTAGAGRAFSRGEKARVVPAPGAITLSGTGVDPSGERDSTPALQSLVDSAPEGALLWLPAGSYLVDGLVLRPGQSLTGPSARAYLDGARHGAQLRARLSGQTAPVLVVGEFGHVADISVSGNGRNQPAVRPAGDGAVLERVTMLEGSVGFDGAYASGTMLFHCMVHQNGIGVADLVDSTVQSCLINANGGDGISLGTGANDNIIVGNKIEWNDGHGIQAYRATHNVVIGAIVDRNGKAGARLVDCRHTTVVGGVFRRNGRLASASPADDCHIRQENCIGLVVTGITTDSGGDDDGGGHASPAVAMWDEGGADVSVIGNDLTGCTSRAAIAGDAGCGGRRLLNAGSPGAESVSALRARIGTTQLELAAGQSASAVFALGVLAAETTAYRLHLTSRVEGASGAGLGEALLLLSRAGGDAEVTMTAVEDRIGEGFGVGRRYRVQPSVSADGAELVVAVHNAGPGSVRIGVELT